MDEPRFFYSDIDHLRMRLAALHESLDWLARNAHVQGLLAHCGDTLAEFPDSYWSGMAHASENAALEVDQMLALIDRA
jgi:hypothetical protein